MEPLPAGKVLARCLECEGEAVASGRGGPASIAHTDECLAHPKRVSLGGMQVEIDPVIPEGEVQLRYGDRIAGRIVNVGSGEG